MKSEQPYHGFAWLYDMFMAGTDYAGWVDYIERIFERFNAKPALLLELGCGTGSATVLFKQRGYDIIGLDNSPDMLTVAKQKDSEILYINQDMRSFELYGTVDAVISLCDSLNYIPGKKGLSAVFKLVYNYLNPGGLFIFDINTLYKFRRILSDNTFTQLTDTAAYIWDNTYYERERVNEYRLTFFTETENGCYLRFSETHYQRAYTIKTIAALLEAAGFEVMGSYDEKTFKNPSPKTERVFFVARKI